MVTTVYCKLRWSPQAHCFFPSLWAEETEHCCDSGRKEHWLPLGAPSQEIQSHYQWVFLTVCGASKLWTWVGGPACWREGAGDSQGRQTELLSVWWLWSAQVPVKWLGPLFLPQPKGGWLGWYYCSCNGQEVVGWLRFPPQRNAELPPTEVFK